MKRFLRILAVITAVLFVSQTVSAQIQKWSPQSSPLHLTSWNQLIEVPLMLQGYGLHKNNAFESMHSPGEKGLKEGGVLTNDFGSLQFLKAVIGKEVTNMIYDVTVNGLTLNITAPQKEVGWQKIVQVMKEGTMYFIVTVDNKSIGRIWTVDINKYWEKNR